jgi:hypothetical protein
MARNNKKQEVAPPGTFAEQAIKGHIETASLPMPFLQNRGRPRIYNDIDALNTAVMNYFLWVDEHPMYKYDYRVVDKELCEVSLPLKRPYSVRGLVQYLGTSHDYFDKIIKGDIRPPSNIPHEEFVGYWNTIKGMIWQQKFDGAAVGFFNANLIARDLGLADKTEIEVPKPSDQIEFE